MTTYQDIWYQSADGLKLYARDYPNESSELTLLCMHGLTRNSADFEPLCEQLHSSYRLVVPDQRGRGRSDYDTDPANYQPVTYVQDMFLLIEKLQLKNVVLIGTSMGGLMGMMMLAMKPKKIIGLVLNDIGPEVATEGLERIKSYVGKSKPVKTWEDAVTRVMSTSKAAFPKFTTQDWKNFTHRLYSENAQGQPMLSYDPAIAVPIAKDNDNAVPPNLWPLFAAVKNVPSLLIRGALSDILSMDCVKEMQVRVPTMGFVNIADVGHAPILDEPVAVSAIKEFLTTLTVGHHESRK